MKKVLLIIAEVIVVAICKVIARENPIAGLIITAACIVIGVCIYIFSDKIKDENDIDYEIVEGKKQPGNQSRKEYLESNVPSYIIKICKEEKDISEMENRLNLYVKKRHIDKRTMKALIEEYGINH